MTEPSSPEQWHAKNHNRVVSITNCWKCQRAKAVCHSKLRYWTREAADLAVNRFNQTFGWAKQCTRYRCRWCGDWHLTTSRTKVQLKRGEKQRRKHLIAASRP
jgi:hypothetical protein